MINKHLIKGMYLGGHELSLQLWISSLSVSSGGTQALAPQALCQIS